MSRLCALARLSASIKSARASVDGDAEGLPLVARGGHEVGLCDGLDGTGGGDGRWGVVSRCHAMLSLRSANENEKGTLSRPLGSVKGLPRPWETPAS